MYISDETTTQVNPDQDEDKILILSGLERLEYFTEESSDELKSLPKNRRAITRCISILFN